ncbi:hypothetical protein WA026_020513 [Henosepilachna vigintioctopunctata]|uniref:Reverse transcriptase domain-containing protein n=1 Tax=Henosepilachna vigintioctopunctata TaxID=420089 RepID=A0AAW1VFJ5_9CUCU
MGVTSMDTKEFNFRKANFPLIYQMILNISSNSVLESTQIDETCNKFYSILNDVFLQTVPYKIKRKRRFSSWYTSNIIDNILRKEKYRNNFKRYGNNLYLARYKSLRKTIKNYIDSTYKNFIQTAENNIVQNPSSFWSFINEKKGISRIPGEMGDGERTYHKPTSIATAFAEYFSSVYDISLNNNSCYVNHSDGHDAICISSIARNQIIIAAKKLSNKLTSGPDEIPIFIVKDCIYVLSDPLTQIFNLIISKATIPKIWRSAKIVSVLKKVDPSVVNNYRPTSILSNFSKLFEIVVYNAIYPVVRNSIKIEQHGFMLMKSCSSNLMLFSQYVSEVLDSTGQVDVIYTDLQKAFDKVAHALLVQKLHNKFGFSDSLTNFFHSCLVDRRYSRLSSYLPLE